MGLSTAFQAEARALLGTKGWSDDPDRIAPKLADWRGRWRGSAAYLALPATVEETAALVRLCARERVAIVPQGGNTGLVGGQLPDGELLVSTERLRAIRDVAPVDDCVIVEAGVTLLETQQAAAAAGRLFPLSLAAEGSATVGGAVATNAGGVGVLRYGMMRDLVLGIEAVLPDGSIFPGLSRLRKNNTGYDLKQLLIGSEGTLGIVTAASLRLFPAVVARATALAGLPSAESALAVLARAKAAAAVEAFELVSRCGVELACRHVDRVQGPFDAPHAWYALVELSAPTAEQANEALETVMGAALEDGSVADAAIAQTEAQRAGLWRLREEQTAAQRAAGTSWSHDVSVPVSRIPALLARTAAAIGQALPGARPMPFGHVGDGNIHYNIVQPEGADPATLAASGEAAGRIVHAIVHALDGSISAEHGLGRMKSDAARAYLSPVAIAAMRSVRAALDPHHIMNPAVLF